MTFTEENFWDDSKPSVKPQILARYNRRMGYVDNSDRMGYSYSICRRKFKWTTILFFHLLDLTVLNNWILLSSRGARCTHREFRLPVRNLMEEARRSQDRPTPIFVARPSSSAANVWDWTFVITSTGQQNAANSAAVFVQRAASEGVQRRSAQNVMWVCPW